MVEVLFASAWRFSKHRYLELALMNPFDGRRETDGSGFQRRFYCPGDVG